MSGKYFVDTNILVYAHDRNAGDKHIRARKVIDELWNSGEGVLSTQVLQEFSYNLRKRATRPLAAEEVKLLILDYSTWQVVTNTSASIVRALEFEERFRISFWDALIIQAAEAAGAFVLYSEDLSNGQLYGTIRVINPLISSAS